MSKKVIKRYAKQQYANLLEQMQWHSLWMVVQIWFMCWKEGWNQRKKKVCESGLTAYFSFYFFEPMFFSFWMDVIALLNLQNNFTHEEIEVSC